MQIIDLLGVSIKYLDVVVIMDDIYYDHYQQFHRSGDVIWRT